MGNANSMQACLTRPCLFDGQDILLHASLICTYLILLLCRFRELKAYIIERRDALREESLGGRGSAGKATRGFAA